MKFGSFPKLALMSVTAGALALVLTGCGAVANNPEALTELQYRRQPVAER
jgi:hypothetical protein